MDEQKYWNPIIETLPREKLQQLQFKKFKRIFRWAYEHSKFYKGFYRDAGIEPGDIKSFEDVHKVPKIEKSMMRDIQGEGKEPYPFGEILCVPTEELTCFRQTSGTTGQPVYWGDTWQDWDWGVETYAQILWAQGYRSSDRFFLPFGYNIFIAFWTAHYAAEKLGCEVIPGGVLNTEARILKMQELKATAMAATPSYVLNMASVAKNKLGIDPAKDLYIEKITVAGEPGGSIPASRKRMEDAWGAKVYDQAGSTELGHWGFECDCQSGLHVNEAFFLFEIEDIDTGEAITEPGKKGRMVATPLDRMALPCIRFDSKDIVQWNKDECECGRTFRRLDGGIIGRTDDITKVKGVLFAPSAVEEVVRGIQQLGDEYQIIVSRKGDTDSILLKVEVMPGCENNLDEIKGNLSSQLRLKTNLNYNIEFEGYGSLPRFEGKSKRFQDLRKKQGDGKR
ncbi:MAG: phenylacetate--CoA ligase family protein [Deltaproteobacteria bacterium]|nr:phenylacetate--CoA ligase family protein [Deltaproteobacteria bacterium]